MIISVNFTISISFTCFFMLNVRGNFLFFKNRQNFSKPEKVFDLVGSTCRFILQLTKFNKVGNFWVMMISNQIYIPKIFNLMSVCHILSEKKFSKYLLILIEGKNFGISYVNENFVQRYFNELSSVRPSCLR